MLRCPGLSIYKLMHYGNALIEHLFNTAWEIVIDVVLQFTRRKSIGNNIIIFSEVFDDFDFILIIIKLGVNKSCRRNFSPAVVNTEQSKWTSLKSGFLIVVGRFKRDFTGTISLNVFSPEIGNPSKCLI